MPEFIDAVREVIARYREQIPGKELVFDLEELIAEIEGEEGFDDPEAA